MMRSTVFAIVLLFTINSGCSHHIYDPDDDQTLRLMKIEHDTDDSGCCPLVWMPIVRGNSPFKIMPFSAIAAAINNDTRIYYARKGVDSMYPGIIDDQFNTYFDDGKNQPLNWSTIEVLSNPYECKIDWFNVSNERANVIKNMHIPTYKDFSFTTDWSNVTTMNHTAYDTYEVYYGMAFGDLISQPKDKSIYLLYNNCSGQSVEDLRNWIHLTVTNFTYDNVNITRSFFPSVLESLSMVNHKDEVKSAQVGLEAIVPDMTYMHNDDLPLSVLESAFSIHYTEEAERELFKLYDLMYHRYGVAFNLNSVSNVTHDKTVSINQMIALAAHSNTTVQLLGKSTQGTIDGQFTIELAGVTLGEERMSPWTSKRIIAALDRLDFPLIDQLKEVDGRLILNYNVTIYVDTIQDTKMITTDVPLY